MTTHGEILVYRTDDGTVIAATSEDFSIARTEASRQVTRPIRHYNLDAIISVGYRMKSKVATRFRIWAPERLKEYLRSSPWPPTTTQATRTHSASSLSSRTSSTSPRPARPQRKRVFMQDWEQKLDEFLHFNERDVLPDAGSVRKQTADEHAAVQYEEFSARRREYKEFHGAKDYLRQLEDVARND